MEAEVFRPEFNLRCHNNDKQIEAAPQKGEGKVELKSGGKNELRASEIC